MKRMLLGIWLLLCLGLASCGMVKTGEPITIVVNYNTDYAKEAALSQEDADKIWEIFGDVSWDNTRTFDTGSYAFRTDDGELFLYETEYGIFNDTNRRRCFSVNDEQMEILGEIVDKYEEALTLTAVSIGKWDGDGTLTTADLSAEDARKISRILNMCTWEEGQLSLEYDCLVVLSDGSSLGYFDGTDGTVGTFIDSSNWLYCDLSDSDRDTVNEILESYGVIPAEE